MLVSSALIQLLTGFLNLLGWYPWPWNFITVHYLLAFVVIGSILVHVGVKLPDINYGLRAELADADVLTEIPWSQNPAAHSNAGTVTPPRRRAQHQMAQPDRGGVMKTWRYGLITAGILVLLYGAARLTVQLPGTLPGLALWMVGIVVIHDAVLSPLIIGFGWLLARLVPPRGRRYMQSALITGGLTTIIALPMIYRQGTQPPSKAQLLQNYTGNLTILLAVVATPNLTTYAAATIRDHHHPRHVATGQ